MRYDNPLKILSKKAILTIPLMLFLGTDINAQDRAVITSTILEMNNSFPQPGKPGVSPDTHGCPRAHQGLYNEQVHLDETQDDYSQVHYKNITYTIDGTPSTFWTYSKGIMPLAEVERRELSGAIPHPDYAQEPTIVLQYPWQNFSVGTRLKRTPADDTEATFGIERVDYQKNKIVVDSVPRNNALEEIRQDAQLTRERFVALINGLINRVKKSGENNVIPYVWGGSSFLEPYTQDSFYKDDGVWHRDGKRDPYTGYDCSEFIMRMAQIAGIAFPWKTTTAIKHGQRRLTQGDSLQNGDIIWVQGHVMTVSDIERNEMIEARGYGAGYGCVHSITLNQAFAEVENYSDLLERYYADQTITFKDKQGVPSKKSNAFLLLKLMD